MAGKGPEEVQKNAYAKVDGIKKIVWGLSRSEQ